MMTEEKKFTSDDRLEIKNFEGGTVITLTDSDLSTEEILDSRPWEDQSKVLGDSTKTFFATIGGKEVVVKRKDKYKKDHIQLAEEKINRFESEIGNAGHNVAFLQQLKLENAQSDWEMMKYATSVIGEILAVSSAKERYERKYNERLKIAEPLGAFIDRNTKKKFVIFQKVPGDFYRQVLGERKNELRSQIRSLGVKPYDFQLATFVEKKDGEYVYTDWILDTEGWILER